MNSARFWITLLIMVVIVVVAVGCGQRESAEAPEEQQIEQPTQPPAAQSPETPATGAEAQLANANVDQGRQIYQDRCASCHGATGKPVAAFADQSADFSSEAYQDTPAQQIFDITKNGKGAMPAYKDQLSDKQIWDVTAYIKTL